MKRRDFLARSTAWVVLSAKGINANYVKRAVIQGHVSGKGKSIAGVRVSDGLTVVKTDKNGCFELPVGPGSADFVFICTPPGYWTEHYYTRISDIKENHGLDFKLEAMKQSENFTIAFITDVHVNRRRHGIRKFRETIAEINSLKPAFVWDTGDLCVYPDSGETYIDCIKDLSMPLRICPGNHDLGLNDKNPRDLFSSSFGPTYYSFDWSGIHCVVIDSNMIVNRQGEKTVDAAIDKSQLQWLNADLAATPPGMPVILSVHIPIVSSYIRRRGGGSFPENFHIAPQFNKARKEELIEILSKYNVKLVLQGHAHENERTVVKGIEFVSSISVCGSWWSAEEGFERGVDNVPRGYRIIEVRQKQIRHYYVSSCESKVNRDGEFMELDMGVRQMSKARFLYNCYDAPNGSKAECRIDQGIWKTMQPFREKGGPYKMGIPHHFILIIDTKALAIGKHRIYVRVHWPDNTVIKESKVFDIVKD